MVGTMMAPMAGDILEMPGKWSTHPKFGEQIKILEYKTKAPVTVYGIHKYLGSGMIKSIPIPIYRRDFNTFNYL
jgi:exodeoxyribonuclease V alpha subunit